MFKKSMRLLLIFLCVCLLISCERTSDFLSEKDVLKDIEAPTMTTTPINGTWEVDRVEPIKIDGTAEESMYTVGDRLYINMKLFRFSDLITAEPSYKAIRVNVADFLFKNYARYAENLGIGDIQSDIIILTDDNIGIFQYIIKMNDEEIIFPYQGYFFFMKKISEDVDTAVLDESRRIYANMSSAAVQEHVESLDQVSLLIGIRSVTEPSEQIERNSYSTFLIQWNGQENTKPIIYQCPQIFLPRKSGFWIIDNERRDDDGMVVDKLYAIPADTDLEMNLLFAENSILKNLTYIGPDFISTSNRYTLSVEKETVPGLYELNQLDDYIPIDVEELGGKLGLDAFQEVVAKAKNDALNFSVGEDNIHLPDRTEFGITHQQGSWIFYTTMRIQDNDILTYEEYRINLVPRIKIFANNNLSIPWKEIKSFNLETIDAVTSPNGEFVIIQTPNAMTLYGLEDGKIRSNLKYSIETKESDKIIMTEWGSGNLADYWKNEFMKQESVQEVKTY